MRTTSAGFTNRRLIAQADAKGQQRLAETLRRVQARLDRIIPPWKRSRVTAPAMARADNSSFLAQANARRHQAALSAAHHAIQQLQRQGQAVSLSMVAQSAGVSRAWLYRQDQIRDLISRQQALKPPAVRRATAQRATAGSLRQWLDAARAEITRLRAENRSLREQIARHLGYPDCHSSLRQDLPRHEEQMHWKRRKRGWRSCKRNSEGFRVASGAWMP